MGMNWNSADFLGHGCTRQAPRGLAVQGPAARRMGARTDADALYALGISYSTGTEGVAVDLVEAHKWFNLAAVAGLPAAADARADVAEDMTAREIAEAQRQARAWLVAVQARAA